MPRRTVRELRDGDVVHEVYLVADKQLRANRNAALYLSIDLRDSTGLMNGRMWNVLESTVAHIGVGQYVKVRGKVQLFQGTLQMIISGLELEPAENVDPAEFQPQLSQDVQAMLRELNELLRTATDPDVNQLIGLFLDDAPLMAEFMTTPAGVKAHHAYPGGLVEHVLALAKLADRVCPLYPQVSRDLLLVGVLLHDLGKIRELSSATSLSYTDEGQLLGHLVIGVEMLNEKLAIWEATRGAKFPEEKKLRIKHMILSHHGSYEFGSPRLPMTPEALALHLIDMLDAKLYEMTQAINDDPHGDSHWTLFQPRLDRKLFKGARPPAVESNPAS